MCICFGGEGGLSYDLNHFHIAMRLKHQAASDWRANLLNKVSHGRFLWQCISLQVFSRICASMYVLAKRCARTRIQTPQHCKKSMVKLKQANHTYTLSSKVPPQKRSKVSGGGGKVKAPAGSTSFGGGGRDERGPNPFSHQTFHPDPNTSSQWLLNHSDCLAEPPQESGKGFCQSLLALDQLWKTRRAPNVHQQMWLCTTRRPFQRLGGLLSNHPN